MLNYHAVYIEPRMIYHPLWKRVGKLGQNLGHDWSIRVSVLGRVRTKNLGPLRGWSFKIKEAVEAALDELFPGRLNQAGPKRRDYFTDKDLESLDLKYQQAELIEEERQRVEQSAEDGKAFTIYESERTLIRERFGLGQPIMHIVRRPPILRRIK